MAIVNMNEFSLFAFDHDRMNLLHELQKFKYVHFLDVDKSQDFIESGLSAIEVPEEITAIEEEIREIKYSIDILSNYHEKDTGISALRKGLDSYTFEELEKEAAEIDYIPIYNELKGYISSRDGIYQEINRIKTSVKELSPWSNLNSSINDLGSLERSKIFLGSIPVRFKDNFETAILDTKYTYFENVSEDKENLYFFAISHASEENILRDILRNNGFSVIRLEGINAPKKEIEDLNKKISTLEQDIKDKELKIKDLAVNLPKLEIVYEYLQNKGLRVASSQNFITTEKVNVIRGYIPTHMREEFEEVVKTTLGNIYYLELKEADKDDENVPILLKNSKFTQSFEALTGMYALPKYNEIDPTPLLAPFYLIFFGMMAADIGYGIIMLIATFAALKFLDLPESTKNFTRFFYYLSFSIIAWGLIFGSFFGGIVPIKGLLDPASDYQTLLLLSIAMGLVHIFFALGISAYLKIKSGNIKDAIFDVGLWYLALIGGILFLISSILKLSEVLKTISMIIMVVGMVGIVATGGRDSKSIGGKLAGGLYSLYGISSYVGDFVSYSRLMALGLAGGFIAGAINMMAGMLASKGIIGIIGGAIIFIIGQVFNLGLSLLGAYVHAIRLTFVEFFGKFYEGGGVRFNPFRSTPKYINIK